MQQDSIASHPHAAGPSASETPSAVLAESNHRIANNLSLIAGLLNLHAREISAQGGQLGADKACAILGEAQARIETVGRLHRLLAANARGGVDLADYLSQVGGFAVGSMSSQKELALHVATDGECVATPEQALRVALAVGELVTNAIKYAHPAGAKGWIEIGCRPEPGGGLSVWVSDDGVGLPDRFDPERDGGLGMSTVRALALQMDAKLSFQSSSLGLTVRLDIPGSEGRPRSGQPEAGKRN